MRRIGSWLMILTSLGVLAAVYFATPYLMHAQSHLFNFLQVLAAGAVVAFGGILLVSGVVMRGDKNAPQFHNKMPAPPLAVPPVPVLTHLTDARAYLNAAKEKRSALATTETHNAELWNIELAIESLLRMVESNVPK